jgi:hypothetical protein
MSRNQLFNAFVSRQLVTIGNVTGYINALELEDGSGKCFNVTLAIGSNQTRKVFVRTLQ